MQALRWRSVPSNENWLTCSYFEKHLCRADCRQLCLGATVEREEKTAAAMSPAEIKGIRKVPADGA